MFFWNVRFKVQLEAVSCAEARIPGHGQILVVITNLLYYCLLLHPVLSVSGDNVVVVLNGGELALRWARRRCWNPLLPRWATSPIETLIPMCNNT